MCPIIINIVKLIRGKLYLVQLAPHSLDTNYCQYLLWMRYLCNFKLLPSFEIMLTIYA